MSRLPGEIKKENFICLSYFPLQIWALKLVIKIARSFELGQLV